MKWILPILVLLSQFSIFAEPLPVEHFVRHGDYLDMKLSPDGKHIAARIRFDNRVFMAILDSKTMKSVGGMKPQNNDIIHTVNWVSNERVVFEYAEKQTYLDRPIPTGELYATNIDNSKQAMLYGYRAEDSNTGSRFSKKKDSYASQKILSFLEEDSDHILIIEYPWSKRGNVYYDDRKKRPFVTKLNVFNGKKRKLETLPHPGAQAFATKQGQVNFMSWMSADGEVHAAYRKNNDSEWQELGNVFENVDDLIPQGLSNDESMVYLFGRKGEKSIRTAYMLDLNSGDVREVFEEHETDIEDWIFDENGMPAVGVTYPGKSSYVYATHKSKTSKIHKMLVEAFAGQTVDIVSRTLDGQILLVHVSSDINPGEYYLFDRDSLNARFIWANNSWIDPRNLVPMTAFNMKTHDNVELSGYLTLPKANNGAKPPMVVMIHGGPHQPGTRDYWEYNPIVQLLANRGYAVMQVNYRGSDGYGQQFIQMGHREWGGKMIDDINEATQWIIDQGYVSGDKVCTYGASYGGYAAMMAAAKAPDLYNCAIGYVGIYDLETMLTESDIPNIWGGQSYLEKVLGSDRSTLKSFSPVYHADKIKANVMLIHGSKDRRAPEINSELMYESLKAAGKEPVYLKYRQAGHGVFNQENRLELYSGLLNFLNKNLH